MTKWLLYLLLSPLMTPAERDALKQYVRERANALCEAHLIADMPPELEELERRLDRKSKDDGE
jgi:guanylate kinase